MRRTAKTSRSGRGHARSAYGTIGPAIFAVENYTERAVVVSRGPNLTISDSAAPFCRTSGPGRRRHPRRQTVHEMERRPIMKTLESCKGNRTEAASLLGIVYVDSRNKLHEYGEMSAFKESNKSEFEPKIASAVAV